MEENRLTPPCRAVVVGGSSGSIEVLLHLLPALAPRVPLVMIIVLHRKNSSDSTLLDILALKSALPLREVEDKDPIQPGNIYLAPADYHLLLEKQQLFSLDDSEKVNFSRPSLDVTFESAAEVYGPALVGILLSGANSDGTNGLTAIKKAGGVTVAQLPETAQAGYMPQYAILHTVVDHILDVAGLIRFLNSLE
ncbi:chemotaxis protein CheB [Rhabdobacter roseus]|uniref:protein-glutamate methylesterase n=1 Tax=Rhabdobacter roseus TaxID=1655419 RepID=A0A840TK58_9BACT|nr:chemotaxis protein CheB [Rhabdobacter roseus]MBB5281932.1 two-component system chemotaxis response regulator CheB [Rhabdobacter roseus]